MSGKLGFGMMRLPLVEIKNPANDAVSANRVNGWDDRYEINHEQVKQMVDAFIDAGFTYFDTSYVYLKMRSEPEVRETLVYIGDEIADFQHY